MFTYTQHRLTIMLMFYYTLPSFFEDCVAIIVPLRLRNEFFFGTINPESFFDYLNKTAAAFFGYLKIKTRIKLKQQYE